MTKTAYYKAKNFHIEQQNIIAMPWGNYGRKQREVGKG